MESLKKIEKIVADIERLEQEVDQYASEPLAAYSILPILKDICRNVEEVQASGGGAPKPIRPQMALVSVALIGEIRQFLQDNAFENIFLGEPEDDFTQEAKKLFLSLESEIRRRPVDEVAEEWMTIIAQQVAEQQAMEDDEDDEDDEEYDEDDEEGGEEPVLIEKSEDGKVLIPQFSADQAEESEGESESSKQPSEKTADGRVPEEAMSLHHHVKKEDPQPSSNDGESEKEKDKIASKEEEGGE